MYVILFNINFLQAIKKENLLLKTFSRFILVYVLFHMFKPLINFSSEFLSYLFLLIIKILPADKKEISLSITTLFTFFMLS